MIKGVFTVSKGELCEIPVTRETAQRLYIDPCYEFSYCSFIDKASACVTALQAANAEVSDAVRSVQRLSLKYDRAQKRLERANNLVTEHGVPESCNKEEEQDA